VEYLLEAYYKNADAIESQHTDLQLSLENHDLISSHIQNRVNGLYCALQVTGMNVANFFEESTSAFVVLVAVCVMGTVTIAKYGLSLENHDLISSHIQNRVNGLYCALQVTQ
jgi:hypothetical protein